MEKIDPTKAARVWQRVQGSVTQINNLEQELQDFISHEWTDAATYLILSRRFQGRERMTLQKIYEQEQAHTACLKGIYTLITGRHPTVKAVQPPKEDTAQTLRRCYGREMQCLAQYEAHSADPDYGQVFTRLAQQEREHCRIVLELLGNLKK